MAATILKEQVFKGIKQAVAGYQPTSPKQWSAEQKAWYQEMSSDLTAKIIDSVLQTTIDVSAQLLSTEAVLTIFEDAGLPCSERAVRDWAEEREGREPKLKAMRFGPAADTQNPAEQRPEDHRRVGTQSGRECERADHHRDVA